MKKILIADSGATKTDWLYIDGKIHQFYRTEGLHPAFLDPEADAADLKVKINEVVPDYVRFYGTGLGNPASDQKMSAFLTTVFPNAEIQVRTDLEGSAQAFFGENDGVVAVLGTGSVCAKVESGKPVQKSAALGFAIGDEGSAADLGRKILRGYYRNQFDEETQGFIQQKLNPEPYGEMMARIYQAEKPNRELASIAGEVLEEPLPEELNNLIKTAFKKFITQQLYMLNLKGDEKIIFTGKVAKVHQNRLVKVMNEAGFSNVEVRYPVIESFLKQVKCSAIKFW